MTSMTSIKDYKRLLADINQRCSDIHIRYGQQIVCTPGCKGNCCRIHLSISAVESYCLSQALRLYPGRVVSRIRAKAHQAPPTGPCPLLDQGACILYPDRLLLCRTHGLPMRMQYRGRRSVGCCQKNFRHLPAIPADACIDLDRLNKRLSSINDHFLSEYGGPIGLKERYLIGEALQLVF